MEDMNLFGDSKKDDIYARAYQVRSNEVGKVIHLMINGNKDTFDVLVERGYNIKWLLNNYAKFVKESYGESVEVETTVYVPANSKRLINFTTILNMYCKHIELNVNEIIAVAEAVVVHSLNVECLPYFLDSIIDKYDFITNTDSSDICVKILRRDNIPYIISKDRLVKFITLDVENPHSFYEEKMRYTKALVTRLTGEVDKEDNYKLIEQLFQYSDNQIHVFEPYNTGIVETGVGVLNIVMKLFGEPRTYNILRKIFDELSIDLTYMWKDMRGRCCYDARVIFLRFLAYAQDSDGSAFLYKDMLEMICLEPWQYLEALDEYGIFSIAKTSISSALQDGLDVSEYEYIKNIILYMIERKMYRAVDDLLEGFRMPILLLEEDLENEYDFTDYIYIAKPKDNRTVENWVECSNDVVPLDIKLFSLVLYLGSGNEYENILVPIITRLIEITPELQEQFLKQLDYVLYTESPHQNTVRVHQIDSELSNCLSLETKLKLINLSANVNRGVEYNSAVLDLCSTSFLKYLYNTTGYYSDRVKLSMTDQDKTLLENSDLRDKVICSDVQSIDKLLETMPDIS